MSWFLESEYIINSDKSIITCSSVTAFSNFIDSGSRCLIRAFMLVSDSRFLVSCFCAIYQVLVSDSRIRASMLFARFWFPIIGSCFYYIC